MNKLIEAANCLLTDLNMLQEGTWEPDSDSCQASLDNAVLLADFIPQLLDILRVAINTLEDEYPESDDRYEVVTMYRELLEKLGDEAEAPEELK